MSVSGNGSWPALAPDGAGRDSAVAPVVDPGVAGSTAAGRSTASVRRPAWPGGSGSAAAPADPSARG